MKDNISRPTRNSPLLKSSAAEPYRSFPFDLRPLRSWQHPWHAMQDSIVRIVRLRFPQNGMYIPAKMSAETSFKGSVLATLIFKQTQTQGLRQTKHRKTSLRKEDDSVDDACDAWTPSCVAVSRTHDACQVSVNSEAPKALFNVPIYYTIQHIAIKNSHECIQHAKEEQYARVSTWGHTTTATFQEPIAGRSSSKRI